MVAVNPFELARQVRAAAAAIAGNVVVTPTVPAPWLSHELGCEVRCKLENVQLTGSFKLRGASYALAQLPAAARAAGVVAASSGNHGLGVAMAASRLGVAATVFVPTSTPAGKREAIRLLGANVEVFGDDCVVTEAHARAVASDSGRRYVSPYNDPQVIAGQGTVMVELLQQWPEVDTVYVALGGGGLIAGMAAYGKSVRADLQFVASSPVASPAMAECVRAGRILDVPCHDTWSDSTAGGVESGAITFPLCRDLVDRFVQVDEDSIATAMRDCLSHQHLLVEGAAGVAVAGARADRRRSGQRAAVILCGGNLPYPSLLRLLGGG